MSNQQSQGPNFDEQMDAKREHAAAQNAQETAMAMAANKQAERVQNPEFYQQISDADVDSAKHDWMEAELGPLLSKSFFIANRDESYEREAKWLNINRAERVITEHSPGRLCTGGFAKIAQRVHGRSDKTVAQPFVQEDRRVTRLAHEAATNYHSLGVGNTGLKAVAEATAVQKTERREQEASGVAERAASIFR